MKETHRRILNSREIASSDRAQEENSLSASTHSIQTRRKWVGLIYLNRPQIWLWTLLGLTGRKDEILTSRYLREEWELSSLLQIRHLTIWKAVQLESSQHMLFQEDCQLRAQIGQRDTFLTIRQGNKFHTLLEQGQLTKYRLEAIPIWTQAGTARWQEAHPWVSSHVWCTTKC